MKINLSEDADKNGLLTHIVVEGLSSAVFEILAKTNSIKNIGIVCDVVLTVDSHEVDLEAVVEEWERQMDTMITEKAQVLLANKFYDINNFLVDLEERVEVELKKHPESWKV